MNDDDSNNNYDKNNDTKSQTSMIRSSLCDSSDACILVKAFVCHFLTNFLAKDSPSRTLKVIYFI